MDILKGINATAAFATEVGMYLAYGIWAYSLNHNSTLRWIYALVLPIMVGVVWGLFAAPQSSNRLHGIPLFTLELVLLLVGAALLAKVGYRSWAITLAAVSVLTQVLALIFKQ